MANPPGTIGPFVNVPAPGSPIRSDWPIQITQQIASKALTGARSSDIGLTAATWTTLVSLTTTGYLAGKYLCVGGLFIASNANVGGSIRFLTGTGPESPWSPFYSPSDGINRLGSSISWVYTLPANGSITVNLQINPSVAGATAKIGTYASLAFVGY